MTWIIVLAMIIAVNTIVVNAMFGEDAEAQQIPPRPLQVIVFHVEKAEATCNGESYTVNTYHGFWNKTANGYWRSDSTVNHHVFTTYRAGEYNLHNIGGFEIYSGYIDTTTDKFTMKGIVDMGGDCGTMSKITLSGTCGGPVTILTDQLTSIGNITTSDSVCYGN